MTDPLDESFTAALIGWYFGDGDPPRQPSTSTFDNFHAHLYLSKNTISFF